MQLIRGLYNIKPQHKGCVATIGNFDGVHLGHQAVLKQLVNCAQKEKLPSVVITFEPLPPEYFHGEKAPARISRFREKFVLLDKYHIDRVLCLRFNSTLACLPAEEFIKKILVDALGIRTLVIGDDFCFGHQRRGDFSLLKKCGEQYGFSVLATETQQLEGQRIGSSRVRIALANGQFKEAKQLLGHSYVMSGHVVHGDKRGRLLGFPTANLFLKRRVIPLQGVFAVLVHGLSQKPLYGVANVGRRPTVDGKQFLLEVYLFDFNQEIYGRYI